MKKIITLVGMCGAGKSTVAAYLEKKGYYGVRFGEVVIQEIKKNHLQVNPENERYIRESLRKQHGMHACAKLSLPKIETLLTEGKKIYIDGLYSWEEYLFLNRLKRYSFILVEVYSDKERRYQHLEKRSKRPLTKDEAIQRDLNELEKVSKGPAIAYSDYKIENNKSQEKLYENIDRVLNILEI